MREAEQARVAAPAPADEELLEARQRADLDGDAQGDEAVVAHRARVEDVYELRDDGLHRRVVKDGEAGLTIVAPQHMRGAILARYHFSLIDGGSHGGGQTLYDQVRLHYFWPGMEKECHTFVSACETCGQTRSQSTIAVPQAMAPTPGRPFEVIHVDHKGALPLSGGFTYVLVVVCALTRFTLFIPVRSATGEVTLDALIERVFSVFGYPLVIVSDNGGAFRNGLLAASEKLFGYRQMFIMPHTPMANGLAEAAVKKLKLILDRHTDEYREWHRVCPMAQASVNQRNSSGLDERPHTALFGLAPITLTALEQPSLLPNTTPEQRTVRAMAATMARLHHRLREESDRVKRLAVATAAEQGRSPGRQVQKGDKVWLVYQDSEKARYLRKHGHGKPWRHAFTVADTRPHAVLLEVPKDGSVPDVQPWQSLRKCSFAAPHFHDEDMPAPAVDDRGIPTVDDASAEPVAPAATDDVGELAPPPPPVSDDDPMGWQAWTPEAKYEIERIVAAHRVANGWRLSVKWVGYPDPTPEPLHSILRFVKDPDILRQIEQCKANFNSLHPSLGDQGFPLTDQLEGPSPANPAPPPPEPTRRQPPRDRTQTDRYMMSLPTAPVVSAREVCRTLASSARRRTRALLAVFA